MKICKIEHRKQEWTEGYLEDVTKEQKEELNNLVLDWFNKNISKPSFFLIENVNKLFLSSLKVFRKLQLGDIFGKEIKRERGLS